MLTAFGLTPDSDILYRTMLSAPDLGVTSLAEHLGWNEDRVKNALDQLADLALLDFTHTTGDRPHVVSPRLAFDALHAREQAEVARRQEELAASRAAAAKLIAEYSMNSPEPEEHSVERLFGVEAVRLRIAELAAKARRETCTFAPGGGQTPENRAASRAVSEQLAARGVLTRTVYLDSLRNDPASIEYGEWHVSQHNQIRIVPSLPMRMYIVDTEVALVPLDPQNSSKGAAVIREPGAVAGFHALFESVWGTAVPFGAAPRRRLDDPGSQYRDLLRLLAQGATDEAAARKLGISLRTERRLISDLMEQLDARSRFQLGQRAMEHGML